MKAKKIDAYYVIWNENPLYYKLKMDNDLENIIVLEHSSTTNNYEFFIRTFYVLLRTKAVITSFGVLPSETTELLVLNKYINFIFVGHGTLFFKTSVLKSSYISRKKFNKVLVSSKYEKDIFLDHGWDKSDIIEIGLPRWDLLEKTSNQKKHIFLMLTWRNSFSLYNSTKIKLDFYKSKYYLGLKELLFSKELDDLLKENNAEMYYSLHHALHDLCRIENPFIGSFAKYVQSDQISKYISTSDLFITDYSSLFFDFSFIGTPTVIYRPDFGDKELLTADTGDMISAESKDHLVFNICYTVEDVLADLKRYIENNFELEKENLEKLKLFFPRKDRITERFVDYLLKN